MSKITLNIGLNVGATEPQNQLSATLAALVAAGFVVTDTRIASGEWQGVTERTLVAVVHRVSDVANPLRAMLAQLHQDAIAYYLHDERGYYLALPNDTQQSDAPELFQHIGFSSAQP